MNICVNCTWYRHVLARDYGPNGSFPEKHLCAHPSDLVTDPVTGKPVGEFADCRKKNAQGTCPDFENPWSR